MNSKFQFNYSLKGETLATHPLFLFKINMNVLALIKSVVDLFVSYDNETEKLVDR